MSATRALRKFAWRIITLGFCLLAALFFLLILMIGYQVVSGDDLSKVSARSENAVGVVKLTGEILTAENFRKSLEKFLENEKIKALVVRIDSPGGSAAASEEIYRMIKHADTKKPVVCSLGNMAASGGLYAAVGCRKIVANLGTITGSIGVIFMTPYVGSVLEKIGVGFNVIKSGEFKDAGSPLRKMEDRERDLLQSLVDVTYKQFLNTVAQGRNLPIEKVREFADGRIILGEQALSFGLIDKIGSLQDAGQLAIELAGAKGEAELVFPQESKGILSIFRDLNDSQAMSFFSYFSHGQLLFRSGL